MRKEKKAREIFIKRKIQNLCFGFLAGLLVCLCAGGAGYWLLVGRQEASPESETGVEGDKEERMEEVQAEAEGEAPGMTEKEAETEEPEPAAEPEKTEEELLEERIEAVLAEMTLEEKVLQLFMITPEALTGYETVTAAGEQTKEAILKRPVGGIIYFAKNLKEPEQVKTMLTNTRQYYAEAGLPEPFLGVDEEGGLVARIGGQSAFAVERIPAMRSIGDQGDPEEARRVGTVIGSYLSELGFTMDFAPVADVLTNPGNQVIGSRSFGSDPDLVTRMALAEAGGLESAGIWAVLKHFPGHGATLGDSHAGYAYTDKTLEQLMEAELVPFQKGAQEGISFIMAAHISAPSVTGDETPSTLSSYMITDVLRGALGYEGIVVTDAMNMGAVSQQYDSGTAAVLALQAGVDLLLMPADFESACEGVLAALESGALTEERIEESVRRILRVKYQ